MNYSTHGAQFWACVEFILAYDKLLHSTTEALLWCLGFYWKSAEKKRVKWITEFTDVHSFHLFCVERRQKNWSADQKGNILSKTRLSVSFLLSLSLSRLDSCWIYPWKLTADFELLLIDVEQKTDNIPHRSDTNCLVSRNGAGWPREIDDFWRKQIFLSTCCFCAALQV